MNPYDIPYDEDEEDDFPLFAEDLVRRMDHDIAPPRWPTTAAGFEALNEQKLMALAYVAGYRACVDRMIELARGQYEPKDTPDAPVQRTERVLGEGRDVREIQLGVGGLEPVPVRTLLDTGDREG